MKKILTLLLLFTVTVLLSSCGKPEEKKEADLEKIKADANLNGKLYNEVCFNVYNIGEKFGKKSYVHSNVKCYYINVDDYENGIDKAKLSDFEDKQFLAFDKSDLKDTGSTQYYAKKFEANPEDYKPLPAICRINDTNAKSCISTQWAVKGGISKNYALIFTEQDNE